MLKIDVDAFHHLSRLYLQCLFYAMPRPFFARLSSSGNGLHVVVPTLAEWDYRRYTFDDPMRIDLDTQRRLAKLPARNLLWDVKNGVRANRWYIIRTEKDIENFIDAKKQQPLICHMTQD
jgi:hypothetical protein